MVVADNDTESILYFFKEFTGKDIFNNAGIDNIQWNYLVLVTLVFKQILPLVLSLDFL